MLLEVAYQEVRLTPALGIDAEIQRDQLVVTRVPLGGAAWDAGVRPMDVVVSVDARAAALPGFEPGKLTDVVVVQRGSGKSITVSAAAAEKVYRPLRPTFIAVAMGFLVTAIAVFVLTADAAAGQVFLALGTSCATMLIAALAGPYGSAWPMAVVAMSLVVLGASLLLLTLTFPVNRSGSGWGRGIAKVVVLVSLLLVLDSTLGLSSSLQRTTRFSSAYSPSSL